jgi:DNA repair exonuclease SbcCD ATPase subunit
MGITESLMSLQGRLIELQNGYISKKAIKDRIEDEIIYYTKKIDTLTDENDILNKVILILTEYSNVARNNAKNHFEKIITEALQYVTQSTDYEFVIQEKIERSKASYEFYIKTNINGEESLQSPKDANGGGFVDIISVAAKYAYLELFNDPKIQCSAVFLDEPGKMIDEQRSIKFAEYIKELGKNYNRQTIMITHNSNLKDVADQTYYVSQNPNLISQVTEMKDIPLENIEEAVKESLNEDTL